MPRSTLSAAALALSIVALAGCGSSSTKSNDDLVWCVAPGEVVDAKFKREYPELHISRAACDAVKKAGG